MKKIRTVVMIALTICIIGGAMCLPAFADTEPQQDHVFEIYVPSDSLTDSGTNYPGYVSAYSIRVQYDQQVEDENDVCRYEVGVMQRYDEDTRSGDYILYFANYNANGSTGDLYWSQRTEFDDVVNMISNMTLRYNTPGLMLSIEPENEQEPNVTGYYGSLNFGVEKGRQCHYTVFLNSDNSVFLALQSGIALDVEREEIQQSVHQQLQDAFNAVLDDAGFDGMPNFDPWLGAVVLHHLWVNDIVLGLLVTAATCALGYHVVFRSHL